MEIQKVNNQLVPGEHPEEGSESDRTGNDSDGDFTPTEAEGNVQGGGSYGSGYGTGSEGEPGTETSGTEQNRD
ncbi:hypothetical protein [Larkinella soli]|uniref:hypothetical protein n=1 Tax=Larkinella soli TaxID=1770527 RepID=UPI000FFB6B23|nr:hypothetical protein [Larkinella soli]